MNSRFLDGAYMFPGPMSSASPASFKPKSRVSALRGRPVGSYMYSRRSGSVVGELEYDTAATRRIVSAAPAIPVRMDKAVAAVSAGLAEPSCQEWQEVDATSVPPPESSSLVPAVVRTPVGPGATRVPLSRDTVVDNSSVDYTSAARDLPVSFSGSGCAEVASVSAALGQLSLDGLSKTAGQVPAPALVVPFSSSVVAGTVLEQLFYPPCDDCIRRSAVDPLARCRPTAAGCERCGVLGQPCVRSLCPSFYEVRHAEVFLLLLGRDTAANIRRQRPMSSQRTCASFRRPGNVMAP